jgi:putative ABC transport system ATP-binding protein
MRLLVRITGVSRAYGAGETRVRALDDVDLTIEHGEFVAIVGPSGSGKSTLMNILGLLDRPTAGTYLFSGDDVGAFGHDRMAAYRNRHIGFVFQGMSLLPRATAADNVALPLIYRGEQRAERRCKAVAALESVGLGHRLEHRPQQLSGGEQQRVAIARALAADPRLLLADEPTGALDSETGREILALFTALNRAGRTLVLVTHDASVARHADRIVTLGDGHIRDDRAVPAWRSDEAGRMEGVAQWR